MTQVTSSRPRQMVVSECMWHLADEDFYSAAVLNRLLTSSPSPDGRNNQPAHQSPAEPARDLNHLCSPQAIARRLDVLTAAGWIEMHGDPQDSRYRINLQGVERGLRQRGWSLEDVLALS